MHIESVLGDVKPADRCRCRDAKQSAGSTKSRSFWSALFGK